MVANLARLFIESGGELRAILTAAGISDPPDVFISTGLPRTQPERLHRLRDLLTAGLARRVAERTGRTMLRSPDWEMLFFCLVNARTLREAIERGCDMLKVMDGRCGRMTMRAGAVDVEVGIDAIWTERSRFTFAVEVFGMATFLDIFGWLIGQPLPVTAIPMDYPVEILDEFDTIPLPRPLTMNAGRSGLIFPARYLDYPVIRKSADREAGMRATLSSLFDLRSGNPQDRLVERVRQVMLRSLREDGHPLTPAEVSRQIGCSWDQLRRWLAKHGMSYSDLKESCRREIGLDLLRRSQSSVEQISAQLGYCDSDAFRQAVRKWTGMSPSAFRKAVPAT